MLGLVGKLCLKCLGLRFAAVFLCHVFAFESLIQVEMLKLLPLTAARSMSDGFRVRLVGVTVLHLGFS